MSKDIFAYKDNNNVETLKEHVDECVNFIKEHYLKRGYHIMLSRRMCNSAEVIEDMLINTARLHDIAKAYEPYQSRIKCGNSAFGHEIFSSIIFYKIFGVKYLPFAISILYHHHTISGTNHSEIFARLNRIQKTIKSNKIFLDVSSSELSKVVGVNAEFPEIITFEDAKRVLERFFKEHMSSNDYNMNYVFSILILHPIIRGDNFAASKNRGNAGGRKQKYWVPVNIPREILCD